MTYVTETATEPFVNLVTMGAVEENDYLFSTRPWVIGIMSGIIAGITVKYVGRKVLNCKLFFSLSLKV